MDVRDGANSGLKSLLPQSRDPLTVLARAPDSLTERELDVLEQMATGLTNKEIAKRLTLAQRTVEAHVARVLGKLGAHTRTAAVVEARRRGLLHGNTGDAHIPRHNLPFQLTPLVGRQEAIASVKQRLEENRLVTLTGTGGIGKTRLALHLGLDLLGGHSDGVWFCDFSAATEHGSLARIVATAIGVREDVKLELEQSIIAELKVKRALLILDNCEHVLDSAANLAQKILQACGGISILATSRQMLRIAGEVVYRVPSLTFPKDSVALEVEEAMGYSAVALFVDRARRLNADFVPTATEFGALSKVCRHLDGIPLAIELVAARLGGLSLQALSEDIDTLFLNLVTTYRTELARHQTIRALMDWSYNLLSAKEQAVFRRISVFVGGFSPDLAETVCCNLTGRPDLVDLLTGLVDKSLVQAPSDGDSMRYRLLDSTRRYALEKLVESGEYFEVANAHARALMDAAERLDSVWQSTPAGLWFAQVQLDLPNWRAALEWSLRDRGHPVVGASIAAALSHFWANTSEVEGLHWIESALKALDDRASLALRARLEYGRAEICSVLNRHKEFSIAAARALALYEQIGDPLWLASASALHGQGLLVTGQISEGEAKLLSLVPVTQSLHAPKLAAHVLELLAMARFLANDAEGARTYLLRALALSDSTGYHPTLVLMNLAETEFARDDPEEALRVGSRALAAARSQLHRGYSAIALCNMSSYYVALDQFDEAGVYARESLELARERQMHVVTAVCLKNLAVIAALQPSPSGFRTEKLSRAARLLGFVDARLAETGYARGYTDRQGYERAALLLRETLGESRFLQLATEGSAWSDDQAIAEAIES